MVRPFRLPFLFAAAFGILVVATYGCGGDETLSPTEDAGNDSGLTGGGRRNTSSSSSGDESSSSSSSGGGSSSSSSSSGGASSSGGPCDDDPDVGDLTDPTLLEPTDDSVEVQKTVNGILTPGDVDAYQIYCDDVGGSKVRPVASTNALDVDFCLYIACDTETKTVDVTCESGTKKILDDKTQGCCGNSVDITYSGCSFLGSGTDDLQAYFVITNTATESDAGTQAADQCKEYNIDYQF